MSWLLLAWLATASAQDAGSDPADDTTEQADDDTTADTDAEEDDDVSEEILVLSERRVELAREALISRAKLAGYRRELDRKDRTVLRHDSPWKGDVVVHADGRVEVKRQPIQFRPPGKKVTPLSWMTCILVPLCIRPNGQLVSQRRFIGYERTAWAAISPEVTALNEAIADRALDGKLVHLPEQLDALWELGIPFDPEGASLETPESRRRAILAFWDSRTDTEWGDAVRAVVESFCRAVVQSSDDPFTPAELAEFAASKQSTRSFRLE